MDTTIIYQIRIAGHLAAHWASWFEPLVIDIDPHGETTLTGPLPDQAALHGVLAKLRDLNLTLLAVNRVAPGDSHKGKGFAT